MIKYIIATPGDRAKAVQALLRLDQLEVLRGIFKKIFNDCKKDSDRQAAAVKTSSDKFYAAIEVEQNNFPKALSIVNANRAILGLPELIIIQHKKQSIFPEEMKNVEYKPHRISKEQALSELTNFNNIFGRISDSKFTDYCNKLLSTIEELLSDGYIELEREQLINMALALYDDQSCPVCDTPFDHKTFIAKLSLKLQKAEVAKKKRNKLEADIEPVKKIILLAISSIDELSASSKLIPNHPNIRDLLNLRAALVGYSHQIDKLLPLKDTQAALTALCNIQLPEKFIKSITDIRSAIPEPSKLDAARALLTRSQVLWDNYLDDYEKAVHFTKELAICNAAYETYAKIITSELTGIYDTISKTFSEFYKFINSEDEQKFTAKFLQTAGKLDLAVDFFGRGQFPPCAYHSEGHQDGMGICLYLALMKHLHSSQFGLAVFDDILTSIDSGHRKKFCDLLNTEFPTTQFILTTHDKIWLEHMKSAAFITDDRRAEFRVWSLETGPKVWEKDNVWSEIEDKLSQGDVPLAAATLRRYLEYFAGEVCSSLRASVTFRGDAKYCLGDLLPQAVSALVNSLKKAKTSATTWNKTAELAAINAFSDMLKTKRDASFCDQWQLNANVHYNEWATLSVNDFRPVAKVFQELYTQFFCDNCNSMLYLTYDGKTNDTLRCKCGSIFFNLIPKPQA